MMLQGIVRTGVVTGLMVTGLAGNVFGQAKMNVDMGKYQFAIPYFGEVTRNGKKIMDHIGHVALSHKDDVKKNINVFPGIARIVKETKEGEYRIFSWEGNVPEQCFTVKSRIILQPAKLVWISTFDCAMDMPFCIWCGPHLFPGNPEIFLGAKYEAMDVDGKRSSGTIPEKIEGWPQWPVNASLKEMVLHTTIGRIIFRLNSESYQAEPFNIRGEKPPKDYAAALYLHQYLKAMSVPAGYSNEIKVEIEFE